MLAAARFLDPLLPPAAKEWLQVAERYRRMLPRSAVDLDWARAAAWEFLGKDWCNLDLPRVLAVRAVLCMLYPDRYDDDDLESVRFFLDFSNRAADHQQEQSALLRQLFPEYLGDERRD
jgi:hypothetical protein